MLGPQDAQGKGFSERQMMLRVLCKFKSPVGGISIREHFEVIYISKNDHLHKESTIVILP